jgi:hypothetical protein
MTGQPPSLDAAILRTAQIIAAAIVMGLVSVTTIFLALRQSQQQPPIASTQTLTLLVAVFWPGAVAAALGLSRSLTRQAAAEWRQSGDESSIPQRFLALTIVRIALVEGAGLYGAVVYYLTGQPLTLAAPALSLLMMAFFWPSRGRLEAFVAEVMRQQ